MPIVSVLIWKERRNADHAKGTASTGNRMMRSRTTTKPLCRISLTRPLPFGLTDVESHHLCIMTLKDQLYLAPIEDPKSILDLGMSQFITPDSLLLISFP